MATPRRREEKRIFYSRLVGEVFYTSVREVMKDIDIANADGCVDEIRITVTSHGGDLLTAFALFDHIKNSKKPIDIIAEGMCMSSAVTILQAARRRFSSPHTIFMVHPSQIFVEDHKPYMEFLSIVDQYKKNHDLFINLTIDRSGIKREEFERIYTPRKYLSPEEALYFGKYGLIDEVVEPKLRF